MEITDFTRDLTAEAEAGLIERPIGRDKELDLILKILASEGKSNVLLLGAAGTGKTMIAEGVAYILANNEAPKNYPRKKVLEINLTALNSGAMYVGQFEERVSIFIDYVKNDPSIVVFIDEIHMLMGFGKAGDGGSARDLSQIIKPPLARGQICCVGATTKEEFNNYIASDAAFVRRFQIIELEALNNEAVIQILKKSAMKNKYLFGLDFTDDSLALMIDLSNEIFPTRSQPDKALDVLKRLTAVLQNESSHVLKNDNRTLEKYISMLEEELLLVSNEKTDLLLSKAKDWLGLSSSKVKTIDLSRSDIIKLMANNK